MLGPIIGSGLYDALPATGGWNFMGVFFIISGVFAIFIYPSILMLPKDQPFIAQSKDLSLGKVLINPKALSLFLLLTGSLLTYCYILPLWANEMLYGYGISNSTSAIYMTVGTLTYILSLLVIPVILKK